MLYLKKIIGFSSKEKFNSTVNALDITSNLPIEPIHMQIRNKKGLTESSINKKITHPCTLHPANVSILTVWSSKWQLTWLKRDEQHSWGDQNINFAISNFSTPVDGAQRAAQAELPFIPRSSSCLTQSFLGRTDFHYVTAGNAFNLKQLQDVKVDATWAHLSVFRGHIRRARKAVWISELFDYDILHFVLRTIKG